jgi:NAD(P)-dependent dehydrogenase (short-subunit alcohol dehydrogenase family)
LTIEENTMRGLRDKVAIVAGGAPGNIGGATAIRLAQEGMKVIVADLNAAAAQVVVDDITSAGGYAVARGFDITDESALPLLIARGGGSIVNTMSSEVWMGEGQRVAYQTAKSGLIGLNRHTATIGGKHGVRSNIVAPGVTLTGAVLRILNEDYRNQMLASVRSPRLGVPEDIAAMVAFLFSDDGAYVNGQTILVDGGANLT